MGNIGLLSSEWRPCKIENKNVTWKNYKPPPKFFLSKLLNNIFKFTLN